MADLMNNTGNFVTTVSSTPEGKLGYLLGRAEYFRGLPITAYSPTSTQSTPGVGGSTGPSTGTPGAATC